MIINMTLMIDPDPNPDSDRVPNGLKLSKHQKYIVKKIGNSSADLNFLLSKTNMSS